MSDVPTTVVALAEARATAKAHREYPEADRLRNEIDALGWRVIDVADGFELVRKPPFVVYESIDYLPEIDATADVTISLVIDGWIDDARACIDSILKHSSDVTVVALVVGDVALDRDVVELHVTTNPGWGKAARKLVEISSSPFHVLMDTSTVFDGDALSLLKSAMGGNVAAAGWKGALVDIEDQWRSVIDRGPGEVDVLLGYLMMVSREALLATDTPHEKARYYRNADLELSLALRERGGKLVALDLPVHQERHHGYHGADPALRDRESKRNYDRILTRFRGKTEILSPRR